MKQYIILGDESVADLENSMNAMAKEEYTLDPPLSLIVTANGIHLYAVMSRDVPPRLAKKRLEARWERMDTAQTLSRARLAATDGLTLEELQQVTPDMIRKAIEERK